MKTLNITFKELHLVTQVFVNDKMVGIVDGASCNGWKVVIDEDRPELAGYAKKINKWKVVIDEDRPELAGYAKKINNCESETYAAALGQLTTILINVYSTIDFDEGE